LDRAQKVYEATRRDLGVRVSKEFRGVTESILRIKALEQALRSADQLVISNSKSYKAGSRTVVDVLNAEQQRMLVNRDLTQARYLYLISQLRLQSLTGDANEDAVAKLNEFFGPLASVSSLP
jgi:outer membrane protein/protease secretion system outer membrane protein